MSFAGTYPGDDRACALAISRQEQPSRERGVVHLRAAGTLARVLIGSMRRNGVIRQVTVVMCHRLMQFIAASKKPVAMIAVGAARIFSEITKHHTAAALSAAPQLAWSLQWPLTPLAPILPTADCRRHGACKTSRASQVGLNWRKTK
jgi:hypothetical protein